MTDETTLTGIWDGLYSYTRTGQPENPFTAVLFDTGGQLSGTIHETLKFVTGGAAEASAYVDGAADAGFVSFTKTYDGTSGQSHAVNYQGSLSSDGAEIDGTWTIRSGSGLVTGRFLMIRGRRAANTAKKRIAEKA